MTKYSYKYVITLTYRLVRTLNSWGSRGWQLKVILDEYCEEGEQKTKVLLEYVDEQGGHA